MKIKSRLKKIASISMIGFMIAGTISSSGNKENLWSNVFADSYAESISDSNKKLNVEYEGITLEGNEVKPNSSGVVTWITSITFPKKPKAGEQFTISLPDELKINGESSEEVELKKFTVEGVVVADEQHTDGKITYTFNENVEKFDNIKYSAKLNGYLRRDVVKNSGDYTMVWKVDDQVFPHRVKVDYEMIPNVEGSKISQSDRVNNTPGANRYPLNTINASSMIVEQNDENYKHIIYLNPMDERITDEPSMIRISVSDKEIVDSLDSKDIRHPNGKYSIDTVKILKPKSGIKLNDSYYYDENDFTVVKNIEVNSDDGYAEFSTDVIDDTIDSPYIVVVEGAPKEGQKGSDSIHVDTYLIPNKTKSHPVLLESSIVSHSNGLEGSLEDKYYIGDYVWLDENRDGIQDSNEKAMKSITVKLMDKNGKVIDITHTDNEGKYKFTGLDKGNYTVEFVVPDGYSVTPIKGKGSVEQRVNVELNSNREDIDLGLVEPEKGDFKEVHKYYTVEKGKEIDEENPTYIENDSKSGFENEKFSADKREKFGYVLREVVSKNIDNEPSKDNPSVGGNFKANITQKVEYIYVKEIEPTIVEKEKLGTFEETHIYLTTVDGKYDPKRDTVSDYEITSSTMGKKDESYTSGLKIREGYKLVKVESSDNVDKKPDENGNKVKNYYKDDETQSVKYVYVKKAEEKTEEPEPEIKKGRVTIDHVTESGEKLTETEEKEGDIGESYSSNVREFEGYTFKRMQEYSAPKNGNITEAEAHVVYVYSKEEPVTPEPEKSGSVTVEYIAEDGTDLGGGVKDVKRDQPIGDEYETEKREFEGYTFSRMAKYSAPAKGEVVEGESRVIYIYSKNPAPTPEKKAEVGTFEAVHKYYETVDGKFDETRDLNPSKETSILSTGSNDQEYTTGKIYVEGYELVKVESSDNMVNKLLLENPEADNKYIDNETQKATYIYVKKKVDEPKVEDPKKEDPKKEDPKKEDPKVEDPKKEDPKKEDPKKEDPKKEDPKKENPKKEDPKKEDPKKDEPKTSSSRRSSNRRKTTVTNKTYKEEKENNTPVENKEKEKTSHPEDTSGSKKEIKKSEEPEKTNDEKTTSSSSATKDNGDEQKRIINERYGNSNIKKSSGSSGGSTRLAKTGSDISTLPTAIGSLSVLLGTVLFRKKDKK